MLLCNFPLLIKAFFFVTDISFGIKEISLRKICPAAIIICICKTILKFFEGKSFFIRLFVEIFVNRIPRRTDMESFYIYSSVNLV